MPTYDYRCPDCGPFEKIRRIDERDAPAACPRCGHQAGRVQVSAPYLADMDSAVRQAMATNEKSSHEPRLSSSSRHPHGCTCCRSPARSDASAPAAPRSFAGRRPWMISH